MEPNIPMIFLPLDVFLSEALKCC